VDGEVAFAVVVAVVPANVASDGFWLAGLSGRTHRHISSAYQRLDGETPVIRRAPPLLWRTSLDGERDLLVALFSTNNHCCCLLHSCNIELQSIPPFVKHVRTVQIKRRSLTRARLRWVEFWRRLARESEVGKARALATIEIDMGATSRLIQCRYNAATRDHEWSKEITLMSDVNQIIAFDRRCRVEIDQDLVFVVLAGMRRRLEQAQQGIMVTNRQVSVRLRRQRRAYAWVQRNNVGEF